MIPTYLCPSAPLRPEASHSRCDANDASRGTYAFCTGSGDPWGTLAAGTPHNGSIVNPDSGKTSLRDITDGTSNTLLTGEAAWNLRTISLHPAPALVRFAGDFHTGRHLIHWQPLSLRWLPSIRSMVVRPCSHGSAVSTAAGPSLHWSMVRYGSSVRTSVRSSSMRPGRAAAGR